MNNSRHTLSVLVENKPGVLTRFTGLIARRGFNYDASAAGGTDAGLIFGSFQADPLTQFVPIQQRLAQADLLNLWTTPIGSAVFAIPPGCEPGGYLGETLL